MRPVRPRISPLTPWCSMLLLFPLLTARAADSTDTTFAAAAAAADADKPTTTASADLGATWMSGNTEKFTVNAAGHAAHTWEKNKVGWRDLLSPAAYARVVAEMKKVAGQFTETPRTGARRQPDPPPADDFGIGEDEIPF